MRKEELLEIAKPILFNTEMVKAILEGRKTVTRRVVKFKAGKNPNWTGYVKDGLALYNGTNEPCSLPAPYQVGDILYVRETWCFVPCWQCGQDMKGGTCKHENSVYKEGFYGCYRYKADGGYLAGSLRPSIHMPKEAARLFLRVTSVRLERLQDMNEVDTAKEGIRTDIQTQSLDDPDFIENWGGLIIFKELWDSTIKKNQIDKYGWNANPYVWVIEFEKIK